MPKARNLNAIEINNKSTLIIKFKFKIRISFILWTVCEAEVKKKKKKKAASSRQALDFLSFSLLTFSGSKHPVSDSHYAASLLFTSSSRLLGFHSRSFVLHGLRPCVFLWNFPRQNSQLWQSNYRTVWLWFLAISTVDRKVSAKFWLGLGFSWGEWIGLNLLVSVSEICSLCFPLRKKWWKLMKMRIRWRFCCCFGAYSS